MNALSESMLLIQLDASQLLELSSFLRSRWPKNREPFMMRGQCALVLTLVTISVLQ